jgi:predicted nucleic acid-binding protein
MARELVLEAVQSSRGFVSWQVAQEFLSLATRKFATRMTSEQAERVLDEMFMPLCEIYPGLETMRAALELHRKIQFSFYDCLIVQSALDADCQILYSEDLQAGFKIGGLEIKNPFA